MAIKITGHSKPVQRIITPLHSFNMAFENEKGEIGFPLGKMTEVSGPTHCGKSTIIYGISGLIAKSLESNISLVDLEDFDPAFLITVLETVGFDGEINSILADEDEDTLDLLINDLWSDYCVGIVDSVGAISPLSERKGSVGEANMGRRARIMAQFSRKAMYCMRSQEAQKSVFLINHQHPRLGGRGTITPGGETKKYLSSIAIQVKRRWVSSREETFPDGSYVIEGVVKKNRWGYKGRIFHLFVLAGRGVHVGLTAMYDAVELGLASRKRTIKIGNKSFGYLKDCVQQAQEGNDEFFEPFIQLLAKDNKDGDKEPKAKDKVSKKAGHKGS